MFMKVNAISLLLFLATGPRGVMSFCDSDAIPDPPDNTLSTVVDLCSTTSPVRVTVTGGVPDFLFFFGGVGEAGRTYFFSTCGDDDISDTNLSVFDGITPSANLLVCNDDEGSCPLQTELAFTLPNDNPNIVLASIFLKGDGVFDLAWDDVDGGCTVDPDRDGIVTGVDNCPFVFNPDQADTDNDGVGNVCDNCPQAFNPQQEDFNNDGVGDACSDVEGDGVLDSVDNCREVFNPLQEDINGDGVGDACSKGKKGNKNGMNKGNKNGMNKNGMKGMNKKGMKGEGMMKGKNKKGSKGVKGKNKGMDMKMKGKR